MYETFFSLLAVLLLFVFRDSIFEFVTNHLIKILFYVAFFSIILSYVSTIVAYTFYHFSVALALGFGPFLNEWTIDLLQYFVAAIPFAVVMKIFAHFLPKKG